VYYGLLHLFVIVKRKLGALEGSHRPWSIVLRKGPETGEFAANQDGASKPKVTVAR
jgi:hypothetical protein